MPAAQTCVSIAACIAPHISRKFTVSRWIFGHQFPCYRSGISSGTGWQEIYPALLVAKQARCFHHITDVRRCFLFSEFKFFDARLFSRSPNQGIGFVLGVEKMPAVVVPVHQTL
jgi:hypothetical protein